MSVARDELHKLVDSLPEGKADKALDILRQFMEHGLDAGRPRRRRREKKWSGDGMLSLIGIATEGPNDLAERHDYYLAQALEEELRR